MSDERQIEDAIAAMVGDGSIVTGWIVLATYQRPEIPADATGYYRGYSDGLQTHAALGLVEMDATRLRKELLDDE